MFTPTELVKFLIVSQIFEVTNFSPIIFKFKNSKIIFILPLHVPIYIPPPTQPTLQLLATEVGKSNLYGFFKQNACQRKLSGDQRLSAIT